MSLSRLSALVLPLLVNEPSYARSTSLAADKIIIHSVDFQDSLGTADIIGGNAYDRFADEVGMKQGFTSRATRAIVTPSKAATLVAFTSVNPSIASPNTIEGDILPISGNSKGRTIVKATHFPEQVKPFVFDKLIRSVQLHLIRDNADHAASVSLLQTETALQQSNAHWGNQVNVVFAPAAATKEDQLDINIGDSLDIIADTRCDMPSTFIPECNELPKLLEKLTPGVAFNVFYVNKIRIVGGPNNGLTPPGVTPRGLGWTIIGATSEPNRATAHELGHNLGLHCVSPAPPAPQDCSLGTADYEDVPRKYQLMWGREGGGYTITPFQGDTANSVATP